ncbi:hypothetical protein V9T40_006378 [Parthenolecanium corni]|uniref:type I protein arginine methyltransferase n=1 Tax=Parthenolecanium corni TaxID=536013 RepID=A0AAN9Y7C5_9HEMI
MKHHFELNDFQVLDSTGNLSHEYKHPVITIETNSNGLHFCVKQDQNDTPEVRKVFSFSLSQLSSSSRIGNKGFVFNFPDNSCYLISFQVFKETQSFSSIIQKAKDNAPKFRSKFCNRTEESSAAQYFQFYGYLSQQQNMLQDYIRTSTYEKAVLANTKDFQDKVVLDVGAGSGILSFFSAQAGASRVYAVEASSMAEHAEKLVGFNYMSDKIIVVGGKVEEIELPEQVDIIISEPMGYMLYNERMLETYLHAKKWLKKDGKMFPTTGDLHVAPFTDEALFMEQTTKASFWLQTHFHNIDLTPLHDAAISEYFRQPIVDTFDIRMCTAKSVRHTVNFLEVDETDLHRIEIPLDFTILQSATIHGLAFWFDVAFIGSQQTIWLSTAPTEPLTHWYQVRCLLNTPIFAKVNQKLVGTVLLEANPRQSYDVTIDLMIEGFPDTRSVNCLDLKNPYFRYSGQPAGPPPGLNTVSPSEAYWSQLDAQVRQIADGNAQATTFDISQWPTNGGHIQITNALNNTVNMVNGISLNGYNEVLDVPQASQIVTAAASGRTNQICQKTRQRIGSMVPTSTCAAQLIGGGVTPSVFSNQTSQVIITDSPHFTQANSDLVSNFVTNSSDIMVSHKS